ncbi:MAG: hypothetical protein RL325_361 [Planctomycetota bacterium]|jgi:subtilisin family serine protease
MSPFASQRWFGIPLAAFAALGCMRAADAQIPPPRLNPFSVIVVGTETSVDGIVANVGKDAASPFDLSVAERLDRFGMSRLEVLPREGVDGKVIEEALVLSIVNAAVPTDEVTEVGLDAEFGIGGGQTGSLWVTRLEGFSQLEHATQYGVAETNIAGAAGRSTGRGVIVAVLDTGVYAVGEHAKMLVPLSYDAFADGAPVSGAASADPGPDGLDSDGDGAADECVGHGSFIASIVALAAPQARQLHIRAIDSDGLTTTIVLGRAIAAAIDAGAHVINISAVVPENIAGFANMVARARDAGITVVASSGNFPAEQPTYPGSYPEAASVSSSGPGRIFSSEFSTYSSAIDLCAPGQSFYDHDPVLGPVPVEGASIIGVIGTSPLDPSQPLFATASGTSFSSAWVSGAAALVRSAHPEWPTAEVPVALIGQTVIEHLRSNTSAITSDDLHAGLIGTGVLDCGAACAFIAPGSIPTATFDVAAGAGRPRVDAEDLSVLLNSWGRVPDGRISYADLDGDGLVAGADLAILLSNWNP